MSFRGRWWAVAVAVVSLLSGQAQGETPATQASASGRPRLCAYAFWDADALPSARNVLRGLGAAFATEPVVEFVTFEEVLRDPTVDARLVKGADRMVEEARSKLRQLELVQAARLLEEALDSYEAALPFLAGQLRPNDRFVAALTYLAAARFINGDEEGAREALKQVLAINPSMPYNDTIFPPPMRRPFTEVKLLQDELGPGSLAVRSDPPGAEILLDGVSQGMTPLTLSDVAAGPHLVTLLRPGFRHTTTRVEMLGGTGQKLEQQLERFEVDPVPDLDGAQASLGQERPSPAMERLAARCQAPLLLLAYVAHGTETVQVDLYLYDLRTKRLALKRSRTAPPGALEEAGVALGRGVRARRLARDPTDVTVKDRPNVVWRLVHRWRSWRYFWHSVAVVGAVVVTSVVVGVAVSSQRSSGIDPRYPVVLTGRGWTF